MVSYWRKIIDICIFKHQQKHFQPFGSVLHRIRNHKLVQPFHVYTRTDIQIVGGISTQFQFICCCSARLFMKWMFVVQNEAIIVQNDNLGKVELFIEKGTKHFLNSQVFWGLLKGQFISFVNFHFTISCFFSLLNLFQSI